MEIYVVIFHGQSEAYTIYAGTDKKKAKNHFMEFIEWDGKKLYWNEMEIWKDEEKVYHYAHHENGINEYQNSKIVTLDDI